MTTLKPDIDIIQNDNAKIKVLGVGGGGSNAVSRMFKEKIPKVEYLIFNTDTQALEQSDVSTIVKIGEQNARGLGVGGDPERGRECAEESKSLIRELVEDSDLVFVAAGMGGGTGTGAAPVIANFTLLKPAASFSFFLKTDERPGIFKPIFKMALESIAAFKLE